jgi:alpha-D-ribose 1-methylphosphonate 5-triphosphate synthase subunit PhnG
MSRCIDVGSLVLAWEYQVRHKDQAGPLSPRQRWLGILARAHLRELEEAWATHAGDIPYRLLRRPEIGLVMVRGRAGGSGQPFNLGEMTVTRCAVQLDDAEIVGFGYVGGRDARRAELVAAFDALLQAGTRSALLQSRVIEPFAERQRRRRETAARKTARTRVEFFTMVRGG